MSDIGGKSRSAVSFAASGQSGFGSQLDTFREFGLYLLVSTQRPQKIPDNVLSQADNLVLMRLNSLADAAFAQAAFSFVPPSLIERSVIFRQGEGLIAGKISPQPALLRFGARISQEGGADVPATWAAAR